MDSRVRGNDQRTAKRLPAHLLKALHAEWRKLSPNLSIEPERGETPAQAERRVRLIWTNERLGRGAGRPALRRAQQAAPLQSWNDLSQSEARRLLKIMREESGDGAAYRGQLIARLAVELWGGSSGSTGGWDAFLRERLRERFRLSTLDSLTPAQAHELIEELLSRIARRDGVEIEDVRRRITIRR